MAKPKTVVQSRKNKGTQHLRNYPADPARVTVLSAGEQTQILEIPTEDWFQFEGHPRQRDTEKHAKARHFETMRYAEGAETERAREVSAAVYNGVWYKVNGHTRAHLWEEGELPVPKTLEVKVYYVRTRNELNRLYGTFDVPTAAERPADRVHGAYRAVGIAPQSLRLKNANILDALNIAMRGNTSAHQPEDVPELDVYAAVDVFKDEIMLLDEAINPNNDNWWSGVLAAAFVTLAIEPDATAFWLGYAEDSWSKKGKTVDSTGRLRLEFQSVRHSGQARHGLVQSKLFAQALMAYQIWVDDAKSGETTWLPQDRPPPALTEEQVQYVLAKTARRKGAEDKPGLFLLRKVMR